MRRGSNVRMVGLLIIVVIAGIILYAMPMHLGLDLKGGVHVVLQAKPTDEAKVTEDAMKRAKAIIQRRVDALGVAEPVIQQQGSDRIIVELPGVTDQDQAVATLKKTAFLEIQDPSGKTILTGADLKDAFATRDQYNQPAVSVEFTAEGQRKFADLTRQYVGQNIPHVLDGEILVNPVINEPITHGKGIITGRFTAKEAQTLAVQLKSGALPVPLTVLEIRNVGPILGKESIDRSLKAGIIGVILVLLYMLAYYRLPGGIADLALGAYVLLVLAVLTALKATLTLPGIAGFILSIGMAVDANVIIFERIRDELTNGKRLRASIEAGFKRAFRAILDANVTTLIAAVVLFYYGTGPIKGFAVTLSTGILLSMFTAVVITRFMLAMVVDRDPNRMVKYFGVKGAAR